MSDQLVAGLTAAFVSFLVSMLAYVAAERRVRNDLRTSERAIAQKFAEELMRQRLRLYPGAFVATEHLGKGDAEGDNLAESYAETLAALRRWKVGEVECIISVYAEECFHELVKRLKKNPAHGSSYSNEQHVKIYHARQKFRGALRRDLGLIHASSRLYIDLPPQSSGADRLRAY